MKANDAVKYVSEFVRDTGLPASQAVRKVWNDLQAPDIPPDWLKLLQFAVAVQVANDYKGRTGQYNDSAAMRHSSNGNGGVTRVSVKHIPHKPKRYEVTVQLLHDVRYNVGGRVKPLVQCNRHDIGMLIDGFKNFEDGFVRHRKVMEYIGDRLKTLGKNVVEDLADGEKQKIARMIADLRSFRYPSDLPELKTLVGQVIAPKKSD